MRRGGFTLIEVMAVVALLGLLAGAVAWSMAADARRSSQTAAVMQVAHADRMARLAAGCLGRACVLQFDLHRGRMVRFDGTGRERQESHSLYLPTGWRIERMVLPAERMRGSGLSWPAGGRTIDGGEVDVAFSYDGRSPSYALLLADEGDDGRVWLVFSGLTGQMIQCEDENEVHNLFAPIAG
jgi:prepilin-type N-terminal cleavage/methylation domain-containing protein